MRKGCKFLHSVAEQCKLGKTCNTCPNRHDKRENIRSDIDRTNEDKDSSKTFETEDTDFDSIITSTPKTTKYHCEECKDGWQCTDCIVRQDNLMAYWRDFYSFPSQGSAGHC